MAYNKGNKRKSTKTNKTKTKTKKSIVKIPKQKSKLKSKSKSKLKNKDIALMSSIEHPISKEIEDIIVSANEVSDVIEEKILASKKSVLEDILFKLPDVLDPIVGSPKEVQEELDNLVLKIQKRPNSIKSQKSFNKIHLYMHGYLINIVLKQFPYIKGMQTTDIYQQTLIALWSKAIPNFETGKGMSFLNFAKMCIRRHLITILNTSKTRQLDQAINQAISLDSHPSNSDEDSNNTFSNIIPDKNDPVNKKTADDEAYKVTRDALLGVLSDFEKVVLSEYLSTSTYKEIAINISKANKKRCIPKSVDNALLRIRKKALFLRQFGKMEEIPLFIV